MRIARRALLRGLGASASLVLARPLRAAREPVPPIRLRAAPSRTHLVGVENPATDVWAYGGSVPGPLLRVRQGDELAVELDNRLPIPTTIHWHGLRVPNAMDGVAHLTQRPAAPGETFRYRFRATDAGTFWYHPHLRTSEAIGRGLYGVLIVDEADPPAVDREVVWVLDDWRLDERATIHPFGHMMDLTHGGRLGNVATVNGAIVDEVEVRPGERIRLRLLNAANARIFGLTFEGHAPEIIALDGQPVAPHAPPGGMVALGPGMRADLILDCGRDPGARFQVIDGYYPEQAYRLLDLAYGPGHAPAGRAGAPVRPLPPNPLPAPDLHSAERVTVTFAGGAMGNARSAILDGRRVDMRTLVGAGLAWTVNQVAGHRLDLPPFLTLPRGRTCVLDLVNDTRWPHPIHLHGHVFRILARDGRPEPLTPFRDSVLMAPGERAEIAFVADNPGDWLFHCHILEHVAGGMLAVIRVA